ncbi:hypothetical protein MKW98_020591 [Papaver atlanticum]|uniref:Uncharacterized protein n=1 Tax=Papaver atlanticum TaxID=357466 RepID=A0AAD4TFA0_9MAGN|nr:hypothetical protein MKW98_020591 [Papaver atlanticum]
MVPSIVKVHSHEISSLLQSFSCFFFIVSAYFIVLPLRDEGAMSLVFSWVHCWSSLYPHFLDAHRQGCTA